ncbi:MAG TPA: helix-turn-helix domain-containing protein, partial [Clostridia bacterium]
MMDYQEIIQRSIDQIEDQVKDDIRVDRLAACAGFSTYHFYRIFEAYVGMPVMEYARRRRIAHAAYALAYTPRLLDVAVAYGFETHAGFSKTFRRCMGVSPEQYRMHAPAIPPQRITLADILRYIPNGGIVMEPKILEKPAAKIAGYALRTTSVDGKNNREIPAFWMAYLNDGRMQALHGVPGIVSHNELGLCVGTNMDTGEFDYVIGVEVADLAVIPAAFHKMGLPA